MKKPFKIIIIIILTIIVFILGKQYGEQSGLFKAYTFFGKPEVSN